MPYNLLKICVLCSAYLFSAESTYFRLPPPLDSLVLELEKTSQNGDFSQGEKLVEALLEVDQEVGLTYSALFYLSRFDDSFQENDLEKAFSLLENIEAKEESFASLGVQTAFFMRNLVKMQLGFVQAKRGASMGGALTTRSAAKALKESSFEEGRGLYAIYAYYFSQATTWVPFVSDERESSLAKIRECAKHSKYFSPLFLNALVWMLFDQEDFIEGQELIDQFLKIYPHNRIFYQMKGDLYRHQKEYLLATQIYKKSRLMYRQAGKEYSVRDLSALGNLALLAKLTGDEIQANQLLEEFNQHLPPLRKWMPPSLENEMSENNLEWK